MAGQPLTRARGYPRQPYEWWPGNRAGEARAQHGALTGRQVDPIVVELVAALLERRPDLEAYPEAVAAWARAEARCILYADWHARVGLLDEETGEVKGGRKVKEFEVLAANLRSRLGLDPMADATLKKTQAEAIQLTADLESIRERGRAALERRPQAGIQDAASKEDQGGVREFDGPAGGSPTAAGLEDAEEVDP
jgi:hypothetical protein